MKRYVLLITLTVAAASFALLGATAQAEESTLNQVNDWCETGVKYDDLSGSGFTMPDPPEGATWTLLVIKSGLDYQTWSNPVPGQTYTPSNAKDVSHAILCYVERPTTTTTTRPPSTTTTTTTKPPPTTTTTTEPPSTTTTTEAPGTTTTTEPPCDDTTTTTGPPPVGAPQTGGGSMATFFVGEDALPLGAYAFVFAGLALLAAAYVIGKRARA